MDTAAKKIQYNMNYNVVMSNELIRGKQNCSLVEIRFIRLIIAQILIEDQELKTYTTTVREFADFFAIDASNIYRDLQTLCVKLRRKDVLVSSGDAKQPWKSIGWFDGVYYDGVGKITFKFSEEIRPYELILMEKNEKHRNEVKLTVKFLREILLYKDIEKKEKEMYPKFGSFRAKVIEPAIAEINKYTDITVECEFIKTGRAVTDIVFKVRNKEQLKKISERKEHIVQKVDDTAMEIPYSIKSILPLREEDIIEIMYAANGNCELVEEKYQLAQRQRKISNLTGWMIKAIKEDYKMIETVERAKQNQFNDFPQREYSKEEFAEIERKLLNIDYTSELQRKSRRRSL